MKTVIISSEDEYQKAVIEAQTLGLRIACVSNAGLPQGKARLTFLPEEAFTDKIEPLNDSYGLKPSDDG